MTNRVRIVKEQDAGSFVGNGVSGSLTTFTLAKGDMRVSCEGVLYMEKEYLEDAFYDWKECAEAGEAGYKFWRVAA
jgi:hypothetical protein